MDTPEKRRRRWYRQKRWWVALILWLALVYPLGIGPLDYSAAKRKLPAAAAVVYRPLLAALETPTGCGVSQATGLTRWRLWWLATASPERFGPEYEAWARRPQEGQSYDYYIGFRGGWGLRVLAPPPDPNPN